MANNYNSHIPMDSIVYQARLDNISGAASTAYMPLAAAGKLTDVWAAISAAITVANAVITVKLRGVTIGTITIVQSGSAAGSAFQIAWSGTEAQRSGNAGDVISFTTDGGSTTTSIAWFSAVVNDI